MEEPELDKPPSSLLPGLAALGIMSMFPSTVQFTLDYDGEDVPMCKEVF